MEQGQARVRQKRVRAMLRQAGDAPRSVRTEDENMPRGIPPSARRAPLRGTSALSAEQGRADAYNRNMLDFDSLDDLDEANCEVRAISCR